MSEPENYDNYFLSGEWACLLEDLRMAMRRYDRSLGQRSGATVATREISAQRLRVQQDRFLEVMELQRSDFIDLYWDDSNCEKDLED